MAVINFPDAPTAGDRFTNDEITYEWRTEGYWKSVEASVNNANPSEFAFFSNSVPSSTTEILYRLDIGTGQQLDLVTENAFGLIGNFPDNDQVYDIYINEVLATDTITVDILGDLTIFSPRSPINGPVTIKIRVNESTVVDAAFDGFGLMGEVYTI